MVTTGVRCREFAGLHANRLLPAQHVVQIQDVWDGAQIKPYPKGKRGRNVPLVERSLTYWQKPPSSHCGLEYEEGKCRSALAFPARRGGAWDSRNYTRSVLAPALARADLADLGITLHDLRHTYASWLAQDGVPCSGALNSSGTQAFEPQRSTPTSSRRRRAM